MENENSECFITGDFNIDLLKLNEKEVFRDLFDSLTENSFYPKITLPTIFSNKHGTLIDNLFCKLTDKTINTTSGILIKTFSDHQPYFTFLNDICYKESQHRFIKINVQNADALKIIENELISADLVNKIDTSPSANPNTNYTIIHKIIENANNMHMPSKKVKFNK